MEVVTREITHTSRSDVFKITPIGDMHAGARDCDEDKLRRVVEKIAADKNHFWIGMGDYIEGINYSDKRFDPKDVKANFTIADLSDLANIQARGVSDLLAPIRDRCLGMLRGNHDDALYRHYQTDIAGQLIKNCATDRWGIGAKLDCGYCAGIRLRFTRAARGSKSTRVVQIFAHHGYGAGRTPGGKVNKIHAFARDFPGMDMYLMGHVHDRYVGVEAPLYMKVENDALTDKPQAFGITGTFKKTYEVGHSGYTERKAYPPTALGVICFAVVPWYADDKIDIGCWTSFSGMPL